MKQYKLLRDIPGIDAGSIFEETESNLRGTLLCLTGFDGGFTLDKDKIKNFDRWFEEIDPRWTKYWYITDSGNIGTISVRSSEIDILPTNAHKEIGNYFETKEKAEKHLEWLKARATLLKDAKGFVPDWNNRNQMKYYGYWCNTRKELRCNQNSSSQTEQLLFESVKDLKNSFKSHQEEWKIYFGVE